MGLIRTGSATLQLWLDDKSNTLGQTASGISQVLAGTSFAKILSGSAELQLNEILSILSVGPAAARDFVAKIYTDGTFNKDNVYTKALDWLNPNQALLQI